MGIHIEIHIVAILNESEFTIELNRQRINEQRILLKNKCERFGIDLGNEVSIDFLIDNVGGLVIIEIQRFNFGMGIQIEDILAQVAASQVFEATCIDGQRHRLVVVHQVAVVNFNPIYTQRCTSAGIGRSCSARRLVNIIVGVAGAIGLYIEVGFIEKYFADIDLTLENRGNIYTQHDFFSSYKGIFFEWGTTF